MKKAAAWALCVLWMMVIFMMSEMPGDVSGAQSGFSCRIGYVRLGKLPGLGQLCLQRPCRMIRGVGGEIIAVHKNAAIFFLCGRNIWPEHDGNALRPRIVRCGIEP